jgi:uncharacterized protein (UPF0335 family)
MFHRGVELMHKRSNPLKTDKAIAEIKKEMLQPANDENIDQFGLVRQMLECYNRNRIIATTIATEKEFKVSAPVVSAKLHGFIDRIANDLDILRINGHKKEAVIDYKSTIYSIDKKYIGDILPSVPDFIENDGSVDKNNVQTDMYSYVRKIETGRIPLMIYCIVNKKKVKKENYKPQILTIKRTEKNMKEFEKTLKEFYSNVKRKCFDPIQGKHCLWCDFRESCDKK